MRRLALVALVLASVGFGLAALGVLPLLVISPVLFDSPATEPIFPLLIIAGLLAFPVLVVLGLTRAWLAFRRQAHRDALLCLLLPALGAGLGFTAVALFPAVCRGDGELGCN